MRQPWSIKTKEASLGRRKSLLLIRGAITSTGLSKGGHGWGEPLGRLSLEKSTGVRGTFLDLVSRSTLPLDDVILAHWGADCSLSREKKEC